MSHLEGTLRKADIAHSWHSVPRRPWVGEHARGGPEMKGELYGELCWLLATCHSSLQ